MIVSLEYLSFDDLKFFLNTVFSNLDDSYTIKNIKQTLNTFSQLIIAQSVYALRHCGLTPYHSSPAGSCLVVSTVLNQIPTNSRSVYFVYRLIPLPVIINSHQYIFSNLPKIFGVNALEQTYVTWDAELNNDKWAWSPAVSCATKSSTTSFSKISYLTELFDNQQFMLDICQVGRSESNDDGLLQIDDGIWYFYKRNSTNHCQIYSKSNDFIENVLIDGENVVRVPCNKTIACTALQPQSVVCKKIEL